VGRRGETRQRVLDAALELFVEHGVGGTSLQMIADRLGVTKAAVYYQFPAKEDIILAVVEPAYDQMRAFLDRAEEQTSRRRQFDIVLEGLVDLVLDNRHVVAALQGDPGVAEITRVHPPMLEQTTRLGLLLSGPDPDLPTRVASSMLGGGLMLVGADPTLQDVDRDTLRRELLAAARRLLRPARV
jgi:AcrR family transcriptional regulator